MRTKLHLSTHHLTLICYLHQSPSASWLPSFKFHSFLYLVYLLTSAFHPSFLPIIFSVFPARPFLPHPHFKRSFHLFILSYLLTPSFHSHSMLLFPSSSRRRDEIKTTHSHEDSWTFTILSVRKQKSRIRWKKPSPLNESYEPKLRGPAAILLH